eukprot:6434221-Prymnesium_polylepis.1
MSTSLILRRGEACTGVSAMSVPVTDLQTNERSHLVVSKVGVCSGVLGVVRRQTIGQKSQKKKSELCAALRRSRPHLSS